jgi:hypothetical protein
MGMVAHYDEDEYGMRQIRPLEFWPLCAFRIWQLSIFLRQHCSGRRIGRQRWTMNV